MRIAFLTNHEITAGLIAWLRDERREDVRIFSSPVSVGEIRNAKIEFLISYNYRFIINSDVLTHIGCNAINLHISLLPWNRGAHPNVWSFLSDTPKGVTIHRLDAGLDTGDIIIQEQVAFDERNETLLSSYDKLHRVISELFRRHWDMIKSGHMPSRPQPLGGSFHLKKEFDRIATVVGDRVWTMPIPELKSVVAAITAGQGGAHV